MKGSFATRVSGSSDLYKVSIDHETDDDRYITTNYAVITSI